MHQVFSCIVLTMFLIIGASVAANAQQPCPDMPGDVNSNGQVNGMDILYFLNWGRGGPPPPDSCDCPPRPFPFYAAADVNGNCAINGIDITFFVAYFKGGNPVLLYCPDCPPAFRQRPY